jgi:hypothetical protein
MIIFAAAAAARISSSHHMFETNNFVAPVEGTECCLQDGNKTKMFLKMSCFGGDKLFPLVSLSFLFPTTVGNN